MKWNANGCNLLTCWRTLLSERGPTTIKGWQLTPSRLLLKASILQFRNAKLFTWSDWPSKLCCPLHTAEFFSEVQWRPQRSCCIKVWCWNCGSGPLSRCICKLLKCGSRFWKHFYTLVSHTEWCKLKPWNTFDPGVPFAMCANYLRGILSDNQGVLQISQDNCSSCLWTR